MAGGSGNHTLMGTQRGPDHREVGLGAAHQKVDVHIFPLTFLTDQCPSLLTVGIFTVAHGLLQIGFHHPFQDLRMGAFRVVAIKVKHGSPSNMVFQR